MVLRPLALLLAVEAVMLLVAAIFFLGQLQSQGATSIAGTLVITLIALILCAGLSVSAFLIQGKRYWARGGIFAWQVIQVSLAWSFMLGEMPWPIIGYVVLVLSICTAIATMLTKER